MKKSLIVMLAVSSLFLSGCGKSDVAAKIGKTDILQKDVQTSINETLAERTKIDTSNMNLMSGEQLNRNILRFKVIAHVFAQIAQDQGLKVTKGQVDSMRAQLTAQVGGAQNLPYALVNAYIAPRDFDNYIKTIIISNTIADAINKSNAGDAPTILNQLIQQKIAKEGIKINPRYGAWNMDSADLESFDPAGSALNS